MDTSNEEILRKYKESKGIYVSVSNWETEELLERVEERKKNSGFKYVY